MKNCYKIFAAFASVLMLLATSCKVDKSVSISITPDLNSIVIPSGYPVTITYNVTSGTQTATVTVTASENISVVKIPAADGMSGKLILSLISPSDDSYLEIKADNGSNVALRRVDLEMESVGPAGDTTVDVPAAGGPTALNVLTNVDCEVIIPQSAQSWISYEPATKTIEQVALMINVAPNEDITRRARVTVKSLATELKVDFTIVQKGILNNLFVTFGQREVLCPNLLGANPSGQIFWGDGYELKWQPNAAHIYSDNKTIHVMELHTPQRDVEFTSLEGVVKVSFTDL